MGRNRKRNPRNKKERQRRRTAFNILSGTVLIAAVCVFVFSLYQLVIILVPYYTGEKEYDEIRDIAVMRVKRAAREAGALRERGDRDRIYVLAIADQLCKRPAQHTL